MVFDKRINNSNIMLLVLSISTTYDRVFTSTPLNFYGFLVCFAVPLIAVLSRSRSFGCTVCLVRNLLIIFMMRSSLYDCRCIPLLCMLRFQVFFSRLGVHCIGSITLVGVLQKWQFQWLSIALQMVMMFPCFH